MSNMVQLQLLNKYYYHISHEWISDSNFNNDRSFTSNNLIGYTQQTDNNQSNIITQFCLEYAITNNTNNFQMLNSLEASFIALYNNYFSDNDSKRRIDIAIYSQEKNLLGEYWSAINSGNLSTLQPKTISFKVLNNKNYFIKGNTTTTIPPQPQIIYIVFSSPLIGIKITGEPTITFDNGDGENLKYQCQYTQDTNSYKVKELIPSTPLQDQLPPFPLALGKDFVWRDMDTKKPPVGDEQGLPNKHYALELMYCLSPVEIKVKAIDKEEQVLSEVTVIRNAFIKDYKANSSNVSGLYTFSAPYIEGYTFSNWTDENATKTNPERQILLEENSNNVFTAYYTQNTNTNNNTEASITSTTIKLGTEEIETTFYGNAFYLPANWNGQRVEYWTDEDETIYYSPYLEYTSDNFISNMILLPQDFQIPLEVWPTFYKVNDYNWAPVDLYAKGSDNEWKI